MCGTLDYLPPEMWVCSTYFRFWSHILCHPTFDFIHCFYQYFVIFFYRVEGQSYNDTVDQWCLGILCYEFLVGKPPFESPDSENTYAKIRRLEIDYPNYLSIGAKDLIAGVSFHISSTLFVLIQNLYLCISNCFCISAIAKESYCSAKFARCDEASVDQIIQQLRKTIKSAKIRELSNLFRHFKLYSHQFFSPTYLSFAFEI